MKAVVAGIVTGVLVFLGIQTVTPFPYGLIFGGGLSGFIIWYTLKKTSANEDSLISYRRSDPQTEEEKRQNLEAYRILKKKFLEERISKEEFERQKKLFDVEGE
ncbi:MAG: hypothetical protein ACT4N5_05430 [Nitrosopumilaceae archaeon]